MDTKIERFIRFIYKANVRSIVAFMFYVPFIIMALKIDLPEILENVYGIALLIVGFLTLPTYIIITMVEKLDKLEKKVWKTIIQEIKKIAKEIIMFIPVYLISGIITSLIMVGEPANQTSINESFYDAVILNSIFAILIGPILEEFIFRFIPYRFIKNKELYIIISALVFAALHVIEDTNPLYYIWFYMARSLYYSYRYYKTNDILVTFSIHSLNNLIATLVFIFSQS